MKVNATLYVIHEYPQISLRTNNTKARLFRKHPENMLQFLSCSNKLSVFLRNFPRLSHKLQTLLEMFSPARADLELAVHSENTKAAVNSLKPQICMKPIVVQEEMTLSFQKFSRFERKETHAKAVDTRYDVSMLKASRKRQLKYFGNSSTWTLSC